MQLLQDCPALHVGCKMQGASVLSTGTRSGPSLYWTRTFKHAALRAQPRPLHWKRTDLASQRHVLLPHRPQLGIHPCNPKAAHGHTLQMPETHVPVHAQLAEHPLPAWHGICNSSGGTGRGGASLHHLLSITMRQFAHAL